MMIITTRTNRIACTASQVKIISNINKQEHYSFLNQRSSKRYLTKFGDLTEEWTPALGHNESLSWDLWVILCAGSGFCLGFFIGVKVTNKFLG